MFVDVHAHLVHPAFAGEEDAAAERAAAARVGAVIVNGLEPKSNRAILALADRQPNVRAALGIYPVDAIAGVIDRDAWAHPFPPPALFDVDAEVDFIAANAHRIVAIGECGLDAYWDAAHMDEQERVLRRLIDVALAHDKPLILHTRKAEQRTFEILQEMGVRRADFHCFGGKLKLARAIAEAGYHLSIPPVVVRAESFQRMVEKLPLESLLTETDCPYMAAEAGARNEPALVPPAVAFMATLRGLSPDAMAEALVANYTALFRDVPTPATGVAAPAAG
jgi:TatD DNase family protein